MIARRLPAAGVDELKREFDVDEGDLAVDRREPARACPGRRGDRGGPDGASRPRAARCGRSFAADRGQLRGRLRQRRPRRLPGARRHGHQHSRRPHERDSGADGRADAGGRAPARRGGAAAEGGPLAGLGPGRAARPRAFPCRDRHRRPRPHRRARRRAAARVRPRGSVLPEPSLRGSLAAARGGGAPRPSALAASRSWSRRPTSSRSTSRSAPRRTISWMRACSSASSPARSSSTPPAAGWSTRRPWSARCVLVASRRQASTSTRTSPSVDPQLLELENVVLVPHIGSATGRARDAMARLVAANVKAVLSGAEPPTPVVR